MGKIGGLVLVAVLGLTGCASPVALKAEPAGNVQVVASIQSEMLGELRPHLKALDASDSDIIAEAYGACVKLVFQDKNSFRKSVLAAHDDMTVALDHLTVAAAAKKHLCPS